MDGDKAIAPQSLMLAERTVRIVVAMVLKFGYAAAAFSIIAANLSTARAERSSPVPSTSKPRLAVKSSSFPIITSTYLAISRFTSCAFLSPPMDFQSEGR